MSNKNEKHFDINQVVEEITSNIDDIDQRIKKLENNEKDPWEKFKILSPILSSIVVALIGLWATYSITGAIEKERLDLSHLTAMQELLINLGKPGVEKAHAEATGILLGAFGSHAVGPLIHELGKPGEIRLLAAREGLRAAAFNDPQKTLKILLRALENQNGMFSWQTHQEIIRIIGELNDVNALPVLEIMRDLLDTKEGKSKYQSMVRQESKPSIKNMKSLLKLINETINRINN